MAGWLTQLLQWLLGALMALLCLVVLAGVVSRYVVAQPLSWTEEVARYLFVWISFVGAALGVKYGANFGLNLLAAHLPPRGRWILGLVGDLVGLAFGLLLVVQGWQILPLVGLQRGSAVPVPLSAVYLAIPVAGVLIAWYSLAHVWASLLALRRGTPIEATTPGHGVPIVEGEMLPPPSERR